MANSFLKGEQYVAYESSWTEVDVLKESSHELMISTRILRHFKNDLLIDQPPKQRQWSLRCGVLVYSGVSLVW